MICHAEENAIMHAARTGISLKNCVAYVTWPPCTRCARSLIQAGVSEIVYPKEVETYIDEIDGVNESAVIGLKDDDFGEKVVAIVVLEAKSDLKEAQIIDRVKQSIAGFKVPKEVIFINELPRNAMGKVQKNILRDFYKG